MSRRFRYRDEESSSTSTIFGVLAGAIGGFALGMYVAQRVGGLEGLTSRLGALRGGKAKGLATHEMPTEYDEFSTLR